MFKFRNSWKYLPRHRRNSAAQCHGWKVNLLFHLSIMQGPDFCGSSCPHSGENYLECAVKKRVVENVIDSFSGKAFLRSQ